MKDTICEQLRGCLPELIPEVEEHDSLRSFFPCVPSGKSPKSTWDEARFGHSKEESTSNERVVAVLESLESADCAEEEELESEPLSGADSVQNHVGGDFEKDDPE